MKRGSGPRADLNVLVYWPIVAAGVVFPGTLAPRIVRDHFLTGLGVAFGITLVGGVIMHLAKLPIYREHGYWHLGSAGLTEQRQSRYACGVAVALLGLMAAGLLIVWAI